MRMFKHIRALCPTGLLAAVLLAALPAAGRKPAPAAHAEESPQALLRMDTVSHDFGDVPRRGGDLVWDFVFTNAGTAPLVLTRVVTSCTCLKPTYSRRPVEPGGRGTIRITYQPLKNEPGAFSKAIQVYSNSSDGRHVLTVRGNSIENNEL